MDVYSVLPPKGRRSFADRESKFPFFCRVLLVGNSISDLVELIPSCSRPHSNEVLEVTLPLAERVTELIGVRANNFVTSSVTSAVHVDLAPAVSIESVPAIFYFFFQLNYRKIVENLCRFHNKTYANIKLRCLICKSI